MTFSVENGSFSYGKGNPVLSSVTFSVKGGEILAILGPNGAGKTTLLRCMMGFLPWTGGRSLLDGKTLDEVGRKEMWRHIGYVPQSRGHVASGTILDLVLLGRASRLGFLDHPRKEDRDIAMGCLEDLGIGNLAGQRTDAVSGGELQLALIAKALAGKPDLLVLDEPESNLDFRNQLTVLSTMGHLVQQGYGCIFNTHYPAHALRYGTHALLLEKKGKTHYGSATGIINETSLEKAFGVKTAIREIETDHKCYQDVLPIEVTDVDKKDKEKGEKEPMEDTMDTRLAIIAIIIENRNSVERINTLLHEASSYIIGRMGMPYPKKGIAIITVVIDAPQDIIAALSGRLGQVADVSIKTTYSKA